MPPCPVPLGALRRAAAKPVPSSSAVQAAARRYLPSSPFNAPAPVRPTETFAVHDQVTHDKYGLGVVLAVEDRAVLVDFRPDQRRIPLPCAKLTKL